MQDQAMLEIDHRNNPKINNDDHSQGNPKRLGGLQPEVSKSNGRQNLYDPCPQAARFSTISTGAQSQIISQRKGSLAFRAGRPRKAPCQRQYIRNIINEESGKPTENDRDY